MPIQQLNSALLAAMKAGQNTPFVQRYALLNPAVEEAFDLNAALRGAVGFSWDSLSADQKAELAMAFRRYTISNYTANFDSYEGQSFRVLPQVRRLPNGDVVVRYSDHPHRQVTGRDRLCCSADTTGLEGG